MMLFYFYFIFRVFFFYYYFFNTFCTKILPDGYRDENRNKKNIFSNIPLFCPCIKKK